MERHASPSIGPTPLPEVDLPELRRRIQLANACMKELNTGHLELVVEPDDFGNPLCVSFNLSLSGKLAAARAIGGLTEAIEQEFKSRVKCVRAAFSEVVSPLIESLVPREAQGQPSPQGATAKGGAA